MTEIWKRTGVSTKELFEVYKNEGGKLPYMKYKKIIELFHKKVTDKVVTIGYEFQLPYHSGLLKVVQLVRKYKVLENGNIKASPDWGTSNKLKAELIANGELPLEMYKNENKKIIGNNGGKPWIVYYTTTTYFSWVFVNHIFQKNWFEFTFQITDGNAEKLSAGINDNSYLLFKVRENNGSNKDLIQLRNTPKSSIDI